MAWNARRAGLNAATYTPLYLTGVVRGLLVLLFGTSPPRAGEEMGEVDRRLQTDDTGSDPWLR